MVSAVVGMVVEAVAILELISDLLLVLEFLWPHIFMVPLQCAGEWYSSFYSLHKSAECHSTYALFFCA